MAARFASALSQHPVPTEAVGEVVGSVLEQLDGATPELVVVFASPHHVGALEDMTGAIRSLLEPRILLGGTAMAIVGGAREVEDGPALSVLAASLPGATLTPLTLEAVRTADGPAIAGWPESSPTAGALLMIADPFSFPADAFLARLNEDAPELQVLGGLASAAQGPGGNRLVIDGDIRTEGAVGVFVPMGVDVVPVVSQGCRPIGQPFVVTEARHNVLVQLGGRPAMERLEETVAELSEAEQELLGGGLHVGIVVDEHREEFERGDFLVRNVTGVDREEGAIAVGDLVEVGQTVQLHLRDAGSADEDLRELLAGHRADAALLFTCNGRGSHLFGEPDHDAGLVDQLLGPLPVAGMFCAGEMGPVGNRNFLHGFTASLALFRG